MAIETIGGSAKLIKGYESRDWLKKVDLESDNPSDIGFDISATETPAPKQSFSDMLANSLGEVNSLQKDADIEMQKLASGQTKNIHETMLAVEKAEIAFKTMNQIRMKVIDAYKEVMRMQL